MNKKETAKIVTIVTITAAMVAIAAIVPALPSAMAKGQGQYIAPGQGDQGCNPGQSSTCSAPGQTDFGNPGQCQKTYSEFGKQFAKEICHD
jgi:hypothetical protein